MLVSIVIPAHNAAKTLAACIEACLAQSHSEVEVIVVDDGSTDETPRIAQDLGVHYLRQKQAGPAAARNHGAAVASGAIVAFTDADCVPAGDWLGQLVEAFDEETVAVGGTYDIANPESSLARIVHEEILLRHERLGSTVDFLGSFNLACRKGAFDAAGGFDEEFTMASGEDNDLAYRLNARGTLRFVPDARVAHFHPAKLRHYLRTQMWHGFWRVKLYRKHPKRVGGGDRYAGLADLIAPPLVLAILGVLLLELALAPWLPLVLIAAVGVILLITVYAALRLPLTVRLWLRLRQGRAWWCGELLFLRDLARALGMLRGFWHFGLRKRVTL